MLTRLSCSLDVLPSFLSDVIFPSSNQQACQQGSQACAPFPSRRKVTKHSHDIGFALRWLPNVSESQVRLWAWEESPFYLHINRVTIARHLLQCGCRQSYVAISARLALRSPKAPLVHFSLDQAFMNSRTCESTRAVACS